MRPQTVVFVLVALVVAAGLAFFARHLMTPAQMAVQQVVIQKDTTTVRVLVAADHIGSGQFMKPDLFDWKAWPKTALDERFIVQDQFKEADIVGAVARMPIEKGDPIFASKILKPGQGGFLAAVLKPGMRAVSLSVNRATGNAGLILPGDLVDLVLTEKVPSQQDGNTIDRYAGETVLQKLRVLAIDQTLDGKGEARVGQTATLEVTSKDAEKVLVAEQLGQLSLILRSLAIAETPDNQPVPEQTASLTWDKDVSLAIKHRAVGPRRDIATASAPVARPGVVVMRGSRSTTVAATPAAAAPAMAPNGLVAPAIYPGSLAGAPNQ